ncbi:MAG: ATP-binding protein [Nanoarchaeota archaeon]|nr:ATP-binding protein [Nanoarchaeota archaeon]
MVGEEENDYEGFDPGKLMEELVNNLRAGSIGWPDSDAIEIGRRSNTALEELCSAIETHESDLKKIKTAMNRAFFDSNYVQENLVDKGESLSFFPSLHSLISSGVSHFSDKYLNILEEYRFYVKGKLNVDSKSRPNPMTAGSHLNVARKIGDIVKKSVKLYADSVSSFPVLLKTVRKGLSNYDNYLHGRFVKSDEKEMGDRQRFIQMFGREDAPAKPKFVKVGLVEGNPVLTDVLLEMCDALPDYRESVTVNKKGRQVKTKSLSSFDIDNTAQTLSTLSDRKLLSYIGKPSTFFSLTGKSLAKLYEITQDLSKYHRKILEMPHVRLMVDEDSFRAAEQENTKRANNDVKRIQRIDLDTITQNTDDSVPDNRREIDYFKLRENLFGVLQNGMAKLSLIDDSYDREEIAKDIVKKGAEIKSDMKEVIMSERSRKLRRDKGSDNEFYVGTQAEIGRFAFERRPAPRVKLDDVIGASFDETKLHLQQMIETGSLSRVMKMSAPGGKVRSNFLLIGPYGCGKTELAKAVCADPRVIGASVSVAGALTAYMHESVNNIKRIYDQAAELRMNARDLKPVVLVLDEFDSWFAKGNNATYGDMDMSQIEDVLLQVLDGMENYNGIITMAMTNRPKQIPPSILRRFRDIKIVGQLTQKERERMLKMYIETSLPVHQDIGKDYERWAEQLDNAPGDVVRKVVDEVHLALVPPFIKNHPGKAKKMERILYKRETNNGDLTDRDIKYVRNGFQLNGVIVAPYHVDQALEGLLKQAPIRMQINAAKELYEDSQSLLDELSSGTGGKSGFGFKKKTALYDNNLI